VGASFLIFLFYKSQFPPKMDGSVQNGMLAPGWGKSEQQIKKTQLLTVIIRESVSALRIVGRVYGKAVSVSWPFGFPPAVKSRV
jgi:hypothetical protein